MMTNIRKMIKVSILLLAIGSWCSLAGAADIFDPRVFYWRFYLNLHPELVQAGVVTEDDAKAHWRDQGINNGLRAHPTFWTTEYLNQYPDLTDAFGATNYSQALQHYLTFGLNEGRYGIRRVFQVDASSVVDKIICGYQGWFATSGYPIRKPDGTLYPQNKGPYDTHGWDHWSGNDLPPKRGNLPDAVNLHTELFPDTSLYDPATLAPTGFGPIGGYRPALLYDGFNDELFKYHFRIMRDIGIDGASIGRFLGVTLPAQFFAAGATIPDFTKDNTENRQGEFLRSKDVLVKTRIAAEQAGRIFYVTYDLSGQTGVKPQGYNYDELVRSDWNNVVAGNGQYGLNLIASPAYAKQARYGESTPKPVVSFFGLGADGDNPLKALQLIRDFKQVAYVIAIVGEPGSWRNSSFKDVFAECDAISPWPVGQSPNPTDVEYFVNRLAADRDTSNGQHQAYIPTIYPGFAWSNWHYDSYGNDPLHLYSSLPNAIPRVSGDFMWTQAYYLAKKGFRSFNIAMFDEFDEGTAILPIADGSLAKPNDQYFTTTSADGAYCSSDFYLRLADAGIQMIKGPLGALSSAPTVDQKNYPAVPLPKSVGPVWYRSGFEPTTIQIRNGVYYDNKQGPLTPLSGSNQQLGDYYVAAHGGDSEPLCQPTSAKSMAPGGQAIVVRGNNVSPGPVYNGFVYYKLMDLFRHDSRSSNGQNYQFDTGGIGIVRDGTKLSYWKLATNQGGRHVAVDLLLMDPQNQYVYYLRDSGALDQNGLSMHPHTPKGQVGAWSYEECNLGAVDSLRGKLIMGVLIAYDGYGQGEFEAYIDNIFIDNQTGMDGMPEGIQSLGNYYVAPHTEYSDVLCKPVGNMSRPGSSGSWSIQLNGSNVSPPPYNGFAYYQILRLNVPITPKTKLSYWKYTTDERGKNVAVDFLCTDGTTLRDSGATNCQGLSMHPKTPRGIPGQWTQEICDLGQVQSLTEKTIDTIMIAYDGYGNGDFEAFIDDLILTDEADPH